ncbi:hypothetical protein B9479_005037 [Cryptococcus floricola]|uniref:Uncharacterized protein n=1 Tax=Cryptococcus floricola TaxID=2591691 RepID=A0A5D3AU99_9TREE|nr:hypothetical protein B9479_005037 [Cryptococcus floricola]
MPGTANDAPTGAEALFYQYVFPRLPTDAQTLFREPPTISNPSSFIPLFRLLAPYIGYFITLLAFIIVWTALSSVVGYMSRIFRFSLRLIPVIAIAAWVMASSEQGTLEELLELMKQWAGMAPTDGRREASPGVASLVNLLGAAKDGNSSSQPRRNPSRQGRARSRSPPYSSREKPDPVAARADNKGAEKGQAGGLDFISSVLSSAVGSKNADDSANEWQKMLQDYVRQSVLKASGVDWLFGRQEKDEKKARGWW